MFKNNKNLIKSINMAEVHKMELEFKNIFASLIKPFDAVLGDSNLKIAYKVFDNLEKSHKEIESIKKKEYQISITFKSSISLEKKKDILLKAVKELKEAYRKVAGNITNYMVEFALKDYWLKLKLPMNVLQ